VRIRWTCELNAVGCSSGPALAWCRGATAARLAGMQAPPDGAEQPSRSARTVHPPTDGSGNADRAFARLAVARRVNDRQRSPVPRRPRGRRPSTRMTPDRRRQDVRAAERGRDHTSDERQAPDPSRLGSIRKTVRIRQGPAHPCKTSSITQQPLNDRPGNYAASQPPSYFTISAKTMRRRFAADARPIGPKASVALWAAKDLVVRDTRFGKGKGRRSNGALRIATTSTLLEVFKISSGKFWTTTLDDLRPTMRQGRGAEHRIVSEPRVKSPVHQRSGNSSSTKREPKSDHPQHHGEENGRRIELVNRNIGAACDAAQLRSVRAGRSRVYPSWSTIPTRTLETARLRARRCMDIRPEDVSQVQLRYQHILRGGSSPKLQQHLERHQIQQKARRSTSNAWTGTTIRRRSRRKTRFGLRARILERAGNLLPKLHPRWLGSSGEAVSCRLATKPTLLHHRPFSLLHQPPHILPKSNGHYNTKLSATTHRRPIHQRGKTSKKYQRASTAVDDGTSTWRTGRATGRGTRQLGGTRGSRQGYHQGLREDHVIGLRRSSWRRCLSRDASPLEGAYVTGASPRVSGDGHLATVS